MNEPLISVIVPVYNTGEYLTPCLDSILGQTYQTFELLLVDDGSTDGSGAVCDQYAARAPRVRVFHQENQGVSSARNLALEQAVGEYIAFVDADDYIAPDYLEVFSRILAKQSVGMVFCDLFIVTGKKLEKAHLVREDRLITERDRLFWDILGSEEQYGVGAGGTCVQKNLIGEHRFRKLSYGEDGLFLMELFLDAPTVYITTYAGYYYVQREDSAMHCTGKRGLLCAMNRLELARWLFSHMNVFSPELQRLTLVRYVDRLHPAVKSFVVWGRGDQEADCQRRLLSDIANLQRERHRAPRDVGWFFLCKIWLFVSFPSVLRLLRFVHHKLLGQPL